MLFTANIIHHLPETGSTNHYAAKLLKEGKVADGTVVLTYNQTAGRGQQGTKWESQADANLALSFIYYPSFIAIKNQFDLSKAIALAVRDLVSEFLPNKKVYIKWSNDIYVENRKVAGILIQNALSGNRIAHSIVGIGLNVNQTHFNKALPNASSLFMESGTHFDLEIVANRLYQLVEFRYLELKNGKRRYQHADFLEVLYGLHKPAIFALPDNTGFQGEIMGVSAEGKLVVKANDEMQHFGLKEVRLVAVL